MVTDQPTNTEEIRAIEARMTELVREKDEVHENFASVSKEIKSLRQEIQELKDEKVFLFTSA